MMKRIFTIIAVGVLCLGTARAQTPPQIIWQKTIGGTLVDNFSIIRPTKDGGYILGSSSTSTISGDKKDTCRGNSDYWVLKLNSAGVIQWQKTIGGNNAETLRDVIPTYDGGYLLGGESQSPISGEKTEASRGLGDYWIVKINDTGKIMWQKTMGGTSIENLAAVVQSSKDSSYLIGGTSYSGKGGDKTDTSRGQNDYWIVKMDKNGSVLWNKTYGGKSGDALSAVITTKDGGFVIGGSSGSGISGEKTDTARGGWAGYWILKINDTGKVLWDKTFGPSVITTLSAIYETADTGFILGGYSAGYGIDKSEQSKGGIDYWLVKINKTGVKQWDKTIGGNGQDQLYSIMQTADGGYILGGESTSDPGGDKAEAARGSSDYWLVKLNGTGTTVEWQKTLGSAEADAGRTFFTTPDGGFIVGGHSPNSAVPTGEKLDKGWGNTDLWILKMRICASNVSTINASFCHNTKYVLPWGDTAKIAGTYNRTYPAVFTGCDSVSSVILIYKAVDTAVSVSGSTLTAHAANAVSYQWIYCETGMPVTGATAASFTPIANGSYAVIVTTTECTETSSCYSLSNTGVNNIKNASAIDIYPNPASSVINIRHSKDLVVRQIEIVDMLGKKVCLQMGNSNAVDVSGLAAATYMMRLYTNDGVSVQKITILK